MTVAFDRGEAYQRLAEPVPPVGRFDPAGIGDLPAPARRLLTHALTPGIPLVPTVLLDMAGEIRLKRWMPFTARQVLRASAGFVWDATVGKTPIRFSGGDAYWQGAGTLDFRLWGLIPVARATGPDIDRSAAGRLAAETVAWAPQALTPQMGATWTPIDVDSAVVTLDVDDAAIDVTVTVDAGGRIRELATQRWGDPDAGHFRELPFGGSFDSSTTFEGLTIAGSGRVGWWWGTKRQDEGEFFRFHIIHAQIAAAPGG